MDSKVVFQHDIRDEDVVGLLKWMKETFGYDFTQYSFSSVKRRIIRIMDRNDFEYVEELKANFSASRSALNEFVSEITVNVTEMFRDPEFYRAVREDVIPRLATYPHIRIWHAGCSTGEEVISMAILLREAGLLHRCIQYATDINPTVIKAAKEGVYDTRLLKAFTSSYINAGGTNDFSNYYAANYNKAVFDSSLTGNVVYSSHNLVTDHSFNEFHLIVCRNVLIYFNKELQERVLDLFYESLPIYGYLWLGKPETIRFSGQEGNFETINAKAKIWRRIDKK